MAREPLFEKRPPHGTGIQEFKDRKLPYTVWFYGKTEMFTDDLAKAVTFLARRRGGWPLEEAHTGKR